MTAQAPPRLRLNLLRSFELRLGDEIVPVVASAQRVAAFLALQDRPVSRVYVAGTLWPETPTFRANANLRSAVWRLQRSSRSVIKASIHHLDLASEVVVDVRVALAVANRLLDRSMLFTDKDLDARVRSDLYTDVLPGWDDDWVVVERERFRQLRLHALEVLCERLTVAGRYGEAVDVGLGAVRAEPLRESAHRALIRAHLAEGNHWEAVRQYERCRRLLLDELGLEPSVESTQLLGPVGSASLRRVADKLA